MTTVDSAAGRILSPLSDLLRKPLSVVAGRVVARDGQPFTEAERELLHEVFGLIRQAEESEARFRELEQRMLSLQRENLDLIVRNRTLTEVSSRDTLTGLYNRWYVIEKLDSEINRSLRHGSPMSLLMLDLDHFKRINDTYGHGIGDEVLKSVGQTLRESCRVYDVPGRYGGEEFCIVLPETRVGNTTVVAERIRTRLATTELRFGDVALQITTSIGIAGVDNVPDEGVLSSAALIDRADRALYSAKSRGRNRVETWDGGREAVSH
jgi:diguanylate cyclase (GGDEF)-like protein